MESKEKMDLLRQVKVSRMRSSHSVTDLRGSREASSEVVMKEDSVVRESQEDEPIRISRGDDHHRLTGVLDRIIKISVILAVFLIPLFFLPVTASPIELNKLTLLIILTGIAGVAWMGRMVAANELQVKRSFLSIPILIFTAAYVLSAVFSINKGNSIWGYFGGESSSLMALIFFVLLFYVVANNFSTARSARQLITTLLISSSVVFAIAVLYMFGYELFKFMGATGKGFNPVGTIFSLAVYAGSILVFSSALITERVSGKALRIAAFASAILSLLVVTMVNYKLVWLVLVLVMALLMTVGILRNTKYKSGVFIFPTIIFIFCLFGLFMKRPIIPIAGLPVNISLSHKTTFEIAVAGIKEKIFFGSGPNTFNYVYAKNKEPMGRLSSLSFNQGISYAATLLATTGVVVVASYLFLIFVMGRHAGVNVYRTFFGGSAAAGEAEERKIITPASLFWLFVTLMLFLTNASLTLLFVWWLAFAVLDALSGKNKREEGTENKSKVSALAERMGMKGRSASEEDLSKVSLVISLMFVAIITGFIAIVYALSQKYIASAYYQRALVQKIGTDTSSLEQIGDRLGKAIYYDGSRDQYYSALSDVFLLLANKRIYDKGKDVNDDDRKYIWSAVDQGTKAAGGAIAVDRNNYNNYIKLAAIYQGIIGLGVEGIDKPALENYEKARDLNPKDPYIYNQMARVYLARYDMEIIKKAKENNGVLGEIPQSARENLKKAEENVNKALEIFPTDQTGRLILATISELKGDLKGAIRLTEENVALMPSNFNLALALSILYYKDKDYDAAINRLEQTVSTWEDFSDARFVLGLSYAQKGEIGKAKEQFEKIKELNPENGELDKIIADLNANKTDFLKRPATNSKVEEVQQKIEGEQRQREQAENSILNQEETNQNQP